MELPTKGAHLKQFVFDLLWMGSSIPNFSAIIVPLANFFELVYLSSGKHTDTSLGRFSMSILVWGSTELHIFDQFKSTLEHRVTQAHRNNSRRLCSTQIPLISFGLVWSHKCHVKTLVTSI